MVWQFIDPHLNVFGKHFLPDLLAILTDVGPAAQHELISHNPESKVINPVRMVFPDHDFRSHVARSPAGVC